MKRARRKKWTRRPLVDTRPGAAELVDCERLHCRLRALVCAARQKPRSSPDYHLGSTFPYCEDCPQGRAVRDALDRGEPVPGARP